MIWNFLLGPSHAASLELIVNLHADTAHVLFGQDIMPIPDQNSDGCTELLVYNGRFSNYLYFGRTIPDTVTFLRFDSTSPYGGAIGDVNGDWVADISLLGRGAFGRKLHVYFGGQVLDTIRDLWFGSGTIPCLFPTRVGDLNSDGTDELIAAATCGTGVDTIIGFELGTSPDSIADINLTDYALPLNQSGNWCRQISIGDFNGDGQQDLAVAQTPPETANLNGRLHFFWGGADFDSLPDYTILRRNSYSEDYNYFGSVMVCPGDLNGDGWDDLFVAGDGLDDTSWVYFGGPTIDSIPDLVIPLYINHAAPAGDINSDGYADLIASYEVSFSGDGRVYVFYGGPGLDAVPDIRINNYDDEIFETAFGMDVAGLGDYNGDGIDDFAFSAMDVWSKGVVHIYSGTGSPVDVPYEYEPTLPDVFKLYQNYPNPFNSTTKISFDLASRTSATLSIVNMLGQEVVSLIDKELPAGHYTFEWDGRNSQSQSVNSGVYLFRLSTRQGIVSRKMLLLK